MDTKVLYSARGENKNVSGKVEVERKKETKARMAQL